MPEFDLSHLVTLLAGGAVTGAGFLLKRVMTGAKIQEQVTLFAGLTDISAKMKEHGLSPDDVNALTAFVSSKRRAEKLQKEPEAVAAIAVDAEGDEPDGYWTQFAMNQRAAAALRTADARLEEALLELEHFAGSDELTRVQDAWERFRDEQADFAASQYAGGSIAPLIKASEAEALTLDRIAWARAEVEERRKL